ncbi:MAG: topoisomerase C-terminal repeat-containing protein [Fibrobacter sp.]|uniref:type IA DNA topoisomerase n=1 Tax=Fibrobacter sp. TaxID=35828 RepID=UPI0025C3DF51|nr:type IA DNA topoisomerase [Fibrobacter sp.]MBR4785272.1 topoisomerase C-terminal repeat-containing protein [Fibrobacter sp.]
MILLVAEKPSVANQHYRPMLERLEGEKFTQGDGCLIGKNHCITWCVGHLITLAPLDAYPGFEGGWRLSNLPLLPEKFRLMEIESTKKQLNVVRQMMEQADVLVNGADAGREGNLIFDLVLDFTPSFKQKQIKRLWVNSYVAKDLDKAWKNLEDATQRVNLSYAARLRQRADWMVGLNATRAYTLTAGRGKMISVGRVQTPTLNLVVERDTIVEQFKELFYYSVVGTWKGFQAQYVKQENVILSEAPQGAKSKDSDKKSEGLKVAVFEKEAEANAVVERCKPPATATIAKIDTQQKKQFPQKPFDLTELQKEGNKRFKFSAQQVLDCAQNLYEKKLLTYPRTDSQYLPDTMKQEAYALAMRLATPEQKGVMRSESENFVFINSSKVTDHFAIIPTGEVPNGLPEMEQKIYDLAKERFVQAWLKPYVWSEMEIILNAQGGGSAGSPILDTFRLKLKHNEDLGFRAIIKEEKKKGKKKKGEGDSGESSAAGEGGTSNDSDEITNIVEAFPEWNVGDTAPFDSVELQKKKKSKPKYYTEATLLAAMKTAGKQIENEELAEAMKDRGLGTPATQAGIIETLKKRGFIEAQKNYLVSTARGREVIALMDEKVKSPEMTGEWEYKLSQVEKGTLSPVEFRDGIVNYVKELFEHLHQKYGSQFERETVTEAINCPKCGQPFEIAPWGYVCKNADCGFKMGHTIAGRMLSHGEMKELLANKALGPISGFKSKKGTEFSAKLTLDKDFNINFEFESDGKFHGQKTEYKCPLCGELLEENKNAIFCTGTTEGGDCNFTLFKTIAGHALTATEIKELFTNGRTQPIQGFKSKKGTEFAAALKWGEGADKGRAVFEFQHRDLPCPVCGGNLRFRGSTSPQSSPQSSAQGGKQDASAAYICPQCNYGIPQVFYQRKFSDDEVEKLLKEKATPVLEPFKKNETTFRAALELREGGKIAFNKLTVEVIESPRSN